jgi:hypothetical protein
LVTGAARRLRCSLDNQTRFPDVCAKSEKWFRGTAELFRGASRKKQSGKASLFQLITGPLTVHFNGFRPAGPSFIAPFAVVQWPIAAINFGAGVEIGVPQ